MKRLKTIYTMYTLELCFGIIYFDSSQAELVIQERSIENSFTKIQKVIQNNGTIPLFFKKEQKFSLNKLKFFGIMLKIVRV